MQFALAGLVCYAVSRWLLSFDSLLALILTSVFRFSPFVLAAGPLKRSWPLLLTAPYPFDLAFSAYSDRRSWLPEELAMDISSPTAFLIFTGGAMLVFIPLSLWTINRAVSSSVPEQSRRLSGLLFALTAVAVIVPLPQWSVFLMREVAQPIALMGMAALLGYGTRTRVGS
ncbi:MAG: hypothetical protein ABI822_12540 [Bryobacteraceae bacterium]